MEVAPAEPLQQDVGAKVRVLYKEVADWYYKLGLVQSEKEDDPEDMPQRAEWIGDENFFLGDNFTKNDGLAVRSAPRRFLELVVGPNCKKVARRKLSKGIENGCESDRPLNDLISLLPDECLYEVFRSLSRARDRCAMGAGSMAQWAIGDLTRNYIRGITSNSGNYSNVAGCRNLLYMS